MHRTVSSSIVVGTPCRDRRGAFVRYCTPIVVAIVTSACGAQAGSDDSLPQPVDIIAADIDLGDPDTASAAGTKLLPPALAVFDPLGAHKIELSAPAAAWNELLANAANVKLPRVYKKADVTIDGVLYSGVGIKNFGDGSQQAWHKKPNIRIKFNAFDDKAKGPGSLNNLRLKASGEDPSFLREPFTYDLYRAVGANAPRFSFGRVTVNGDYYGLYQALEHIDKRMFKDRFGNTDGLNYDPESGCFGFQCPDNGCDKLPAKYQIDPPGGSPAKLIALAQTLKTAKDADLEAELGKLVDLDQFIAVHAIEAYSSDADGVIASGANFEMYEDTSTGLLHVFRHGADTNFYTVRDIDKPEPVPNTLCSAHVDPFWKRAWGIPGLRKRIDAVLRKLQCEVLVQAKVTEWFNRYAVSITNELIDDPHGQTNPKPDVLGGVSQLKTWILQRNFQVQALVGECPK